MSHLPNLSLLSLRQEPTDAKRAREEDGGANADGNSAPEPTKPKAVPVDIDKVNWKALIDQAEAFRKAKMTVRRVFRVTDPNTTVTLPSGEKVTPTQTYQLAIVNLWEYDDEEDVDVSQDEYALVLQIETDDGSTECTHVSIRINNDELHLNSLFFGLTDDEASRCAVSPRITYYPGNGDMVLATLRHIAHQLGFFIGLTDAAKSRVRDNTPLFLKKRYLTQALAINRGYGYYEARGFLPEELFVLTNNAYLNTPELMPQAMLLLKNVLLLWTFDITTAPISQIKSKIKSFRSRVENAVRAAGRSVSYNQSYEGRRIVNRFGAFSNHPILDYFDDDKLLNHSRSENLSESLRFVDYYLRDFANEGEKKPDEVLSLRDLSRMVALHEQMKKDPLNAFQKEDLYIVNLYKTFVSKKPIGYDVEMDIRTITEFMDNVLDHSWTQVDKKCVFCRYNSYSCPTYTVEGEAVFIGVEPPQSTLLPPTAVFKPLTEKYLVEFKS